MKIIYQVFQLQYKTDTFESNPDYQLSPFWRDHPSENRSYPWVPQFDTKEEAITFINEQNPYSGEYTILEVYTGNPRR